MIDLHQMEVDGDDDEFGLPDVLVTKCSLKAMQ
jgi:hypothetical protein